ncbi:hypothetical protein DAPPUDRAFT_105533 [Daphnia pulex]|uniref:Uncharacterized protein n=1 Tax=Daphnia pulex TaxID=6669 RepID=E9GR01_DAPPU|nr:hypothetical protein DAPPUDRAFT_105533 [Daphnia pulex]|eukprot:EFX77924.1 hypothetical protein DAPPUDRAFT_105533 [Daphnia pulex]
MSRRLVGRLEEVTLQSECPNCILSSPFGNVPGWARGSFQHNLVTLVWDDTWKETKPCQLRVLERGTGVRYTENNFTTTSNYQVSKTEESPVPATNFDFNLQEYMDDLSSWNKISTNVTQRTKIFNVEMNVVVKEDRLSCKGSVPVDSLPNLLNCVRHVNRCRESVRPPAPAKDNPLFTIDFSCFPPDFYLVAVEVVLDGVLWRHLLFATQLRLRHLANIKLWMEDGTFDIIALPFKQLWSIHGTILGEGGESKSVPLLRCHD